MNRFSKMEIEFSNALQVYRHVSAPVVLVREGQQNLSAEQAGQLLEEAETDVLVLVGKLNDMVLLRCMSKSDQVRALEMIDFMLGQFGIAKGSGQWAQGSVSEVILSVCMSEAETYDKTEYFMKRIDEYFTQCEVIEAVSFSQNHPEILAEMKEYEKAKVSWAFVCTTDIVPKGVSLSIRTLENDTGVVVEADENVNVMIGCMGEVYQIQQDKFASSYEESDEKLDIFEQMFDFIPAVERLDDHTYIPIDEIARICYPKKGAAILAYRLKKRTRVFAKNGTDYFVGNEGDYLAVRKDDLQDVYIIQGEVFRRTYVEKEA